MDESKKASQKSIRAVRTSISSSPCAGAAAKLPMRFRRALVFAFLLGILGSLTEAQELSSPAGKRAQHLRHGINASEWFAQASDYGAQRLASYTTLNDIALVRGMKFDHVRISIDPAIFDCAGAWDGCDRVKALDAVVGKALSEDLAVIVDLHPTSEFKHRFATNDSDVERLKLLWGRIAQHYAESDPNRVFFEIMNEPELGDPYRWSGIQGRVVAAIRRIAPRHTIIVAGASYSAISDLFMLPAVSDDNLIYNFHYYAPHLFTHQGASWGVPFWIALRNVPYPATPESVQKAINQQTDDVARWELAELGFQYWDARRISGEIRAVGEWGRRHHVPLICNEFGVYRDYANPDQRLRWLRDVRQALEQNGIGWTMWDYRGGFGVVTRKGSESIPDEKVLGALGLR